MKNKTKPKKKKKRRPVRILFPLSVADVTFLDERILKELLFILEQLPWHLKSQLQEETLLFFSSGCGQRTGELGAGSALPSMGLGQDNFSPGLSLLMGGRRR